MNSLTFLNLQRASLGFCTTHLWLCRSWKSSKAMLQPGQVMFIEELSASSVGRAVRVTGRIVDILSGDLVTVESPWSPSAKLLVDVSLVDRRLLREMSLCQFIGEIRSSKDRVRLLVLSRQFPITVQCCRYRPCPPCRTHRGYFCRLGLDESLTGEFLYVPFHSGESDL